MAARRACGSRIRPGSAQDQKSRLVTCQDTSPFPAARRGILMWMRAFELGFRGTGLRRTLVAAVLSGEKMATASLREEYQPLADEPLPYAGERCLLVGHNDEPLGVVETTEVNVVRAADVDMQFARDEGEGFQSVEDWRAAHERFWSDRELSDDTLVVCERFRLVERL